MSDYGISKFRISGLRVFWFEISGLGIAGIRFLDVGSLDSGMSRCWTAGSGFLVSLYALKSGFAFLRRSCFTTCFWNLRLTILVWGVWDTWQSVMGNPGDGLPGTVGATDWPLPIDWKCERPFKQRSLRKSAHPTTCQTLNARKI